MIETNLDQNIQTVWGGVRADLGTKVDPKDDPEIDKKQQSLKLAPHAKGGVHVKCCKAEQKGL